MSLRKRFPFLLLALLFAATGLTAQEYSIKLLRPLTVGARSNYTGQAMIRETTTIAKEGQVLNRSREEFSIDLKAIREILAVDAQGRGTAMSFSVVYCVKAIGNKVKDLAPRGSVIKAIFKDGKEHFTIDGQPAGVEASEALSVLLVIADGGPTNDQIFGVSGKKKIGDSWSVNAEHAVQGFASTGLKVAAADVTGSVHLKEKVSANGSDCLVIAGDMNFSKLTVPLPGDFLFRGGQLQYQFSGKFPLDQTTETVFEKKTMTLTVEAENRKESGIKLRSVTQQEATIRQSPI